MEQAQQHMEVQRLCLAQALSAVTNEQLITALENAISNPSVFVFGEFFDIPSVKQVRAGVFPPSLFRVFKFFEFFFFRIFFFHL